MLCVKGMHTPELVNSIPTPTPLRGVLGDINDWAMLLDRDAAAPTRPPAGIEAGLSWIASFGRGKADFLGEETASLSCCSIGLVELGLASLDLEVESGERRSSWSCLILAVACSSSLSRVWIWRDASRGKRGRQRGITNTHTSVCESVCMNAQKDARARGHEPECTSTQKRVSVYLGLSTFFSQWHRAEGHGELFFRLQTLAQ